MNNTNVITKSVATIALIACAVLTTAWAVTPAAGASGSIRVACHDERTALIQNTRTAEQWPHDVHVWVEGGPVVPLGPLEQFTTPIGPNGVVLHWGSDTLTLTAADCSPAPTTTVPAVTTTTAPVPAATTTTPTAVELTTTKIQPPAAPVLAPPADVPAAELPATGADSRTIAIVGGLFLLAGVAFVIAGRNR